VLGVYADMSSSPSGRIEAIVMSGQFNGRTVNIEIAPSGTKPPGTRELVTGRDCKVLLQGVDISPHVQEIVLVIKAGEIAKLILKVID
jgi:hypothetical protein